MEQSKSVLIVFGGLPGSGKTTLAKALANHLSVVYLRIDTIEQLLPKTGSGTGPEGYLIANAIARENLKPGNIVIVDSVNPIPLTREMWEKTASETNSKLIGIEVKCSDPEIHRQRVENRIADIPGHQLPTWDQVINREYDAWESRDFSIETAHETVESSFKELLLSLSKINRIG